MFPFKIPYFALQKSKVPSKTKPCENRFQRKRSFEKLVFPSKPDFKCIWKLCAYFKTYCEKMFLKSFVCFEIFDKAFLKKDL